MNESAYFGFACDVARFFLWTCELVLAELTEMVPGDQLVFPASQARTSN